MNLFILDRDPAKAARAHVDAHVKQQARVALRIAATAARELYGCIVPERLVLSLTHPIVDWALDSPSRLYWVFAHGIGLCTESQLRFRKTDTALALFRELIPALHGVLVASALTNFMVRIPRVGKGSYGVPDKLQEASLAVASYREFYRRRYASYAKWSAPASCPDWWTVKWGRTKEDEERRGNLHG